MVSMGWAGDAARTIEAESPRVRQLVLMNLMHLDRQEVFAASEQLKAEWQGDWIDRLIGTCRKPEAVRAT